MNNICWKLFITFMKIGAFTFGGGWAMISIIEREICDKHNWIAKDEFLDLLAVSQSMPGILAVNISVSVGDKLKGLKGSLAAALGTITPSFVIILLIAMFLTPDTIKNNPIINSMFMGIRPAVVALIIAPVITTARAAKIGWKTIIIPIAVATLIYSGLPFISNPIVFIVLGGFAGYVYYVLSHRNTAGSVDQKKGDKE
ncbi:MAG: chromate transporter [Muribaculaceae bacterium]